jgi:hypothetical protein
MELECLEVLRQVRDRLGRTRRSEHDGPEARAVIHLYFVLARLLRAVDAFDLTRDAGDPAELDALLLPRAPSTAADHEEPSKEPSTLAEVIDLDACRARARAIGEQAQR